ncbi:dihydrolipoamide acetyltransferase family protein [Actinotalea sp. K2]|uniref:dihydrolipoamide acetyltransferase family protein n=1 Tax=Actinotalea sp. K2 TaxID=2939438 RepID=UPI002016C056|nr:dihydrolipoamide acetyltransferase family protein [Actinotalea sp. K2]MCL3862361.1 2-oxo acid dehydrogenase subunit E2 [Actinotalea sp. K2]
MAVEEFAMPDLGEGLTESDLLEWKVAVGDTVELNQVIAEVETAKALVQLPSPYAGTVARLFVEPGATVPVGAPILAIDVGATSAGATTASSGRNAVLVGYGPRVEAADRPRRRARGSAWSATPSSAPVPTAPGRRRGDRPRSFPPVRKLAQELGVDLASVDGSGEGGLVTRDDVLTRARDLAGPLERTAVGAAEGGREAAPREVRTPITGVRKHTAAAMVASAFTAPHATEFLTIDATAAVELVEELRQDRELSGSRITVLTIVAKAVTLAARRHPAVNSRWDEEAGEIVQFGYVNLGIAAATPRGLLVPNIKDADGLDLAGLAQALTALTDAARAGTTSPADLRDGTLSVTNIGVYGIDAGTPILNPGEAVILAVGAVRRLPWEHQGEVALRQVMTLSLSFDHRLVDGEQASRFLADVGTVLARPARVLTMV